MEYTITSKNVGNLCRICLTSSVNLVHLTCSINDKSMACKESCTILSMLESVTLSKVVLDDKKFPYKICQMCLSYLKISYEFQKQFNDSQKLLETIFNESPIKRLVGLKETNSQKEELSSPIAVELIYGENKFDLSNVLVIEEEKEDRFSFEGFLRQLGSEISARFVKNNSSTQAEETLSGEILNGNKFQSGEYTSLNLKKPKKILPRCKIKKKRLKENYSNLDISQLSVKKYPQEGKIVIEEIDKSGAGNKIVKTLYECSKCQKVVSCKRDLEAHKEIKHPSRFYFMCEKCGHLAQTQSQFYHHMQKHTGKRFKCDQCDKEYDTISRLKVHLQVHRNERPYLCNVCGKNFNYAISLTYHLRLHSDKKYVCNICGLKYRMANTLKRHLRTHTKEKPYRCDYCPKRFPSRGEKISHEMLHTGVRPYRCEFCEKGFIKSINLKMHYLSHPGPHQCNFCHKTFIDTKFLKFHMRVHKDIDVCEISEN